MRINIGTNAFLLFFIYLCSCLRELRTSDYDRPTAFYQCLASKGYKKIMKSFSMYPNDIDQFFRQWTKARNAGLEMDLIYYPCRPLNPFDMIAKMVVNMPAGFDGTIYISPLKIDEGYIKVCSWEQKYGHEENCAVLNIYISQLKLRGAKVGIQVSKNDWNLSFGDTCKELGASKLIWLTDDENENFDNFVPFGGWTKPTYKYIIPYTEECGEFFAYLYYE